MPGEQFPRGAGIGEIHPLTQEGIVRQETRKARFLEGDVVIGREAVDAHHMMAIPQEPLGHMVADEAARR